MTYDLPFIASPSKSSTLQNWNTPVFTDYEPFAIFAGLFNYMVSQKKPVHFCFCQNSVKFPRLKLYAVYTIST